MRSAGRTLSRLHIPRPALSLVEVTVSVVIVGVMMVAALTTLSSVAMTRQIDGNKQTGQMLARQLMAEILSKNYEDPDLAPRAFFGVEAIEQAAGNRSLYDDVDDYAGWTASPPQLADGNDIPERTESTRSVEVVGVTLTDLDNVVPPDFEVGLKRITVTVTYNGNAVVELRALRGRTREYPL